MTDRQILKELKGLRQDIADLKDSIHPSNLKACRHNDWLTNPEGKSHCLKCGLEIVFDP